MTTRTLSEPGYHVPGILNNLRPRRAKDRDSIANASATESDAMLTYQRRVSRRTKHDLWVLACDLFLLMALGGLLLLTGCSKAKERIPVVPATGKLVHNGKPAEGAFLTFHPVSKDAVPEDVRPSAHVGADGQFTLSTYDKGDGAPPGEYVVTVQWQKLLPKKPGEDVELGPQLAPKEYQDPATSKLRVELKESANDIGELKLVGSANTPAPVNSVAPGTFSE